MAKKCPYYQSIRDDPKKLENCPIAGACPHAAKGTPGSYKDALKKCPHLAGSDAGADSKSGCPLDGKCPYVGAHKGEHAGEKGCPLQTGGCPYYDKHAKDQNAADIVASDSASGCPMVKCPYFDVSFLF